MGICRGNTTSIGRYNDEEIPVLEGYGGEGACFRIISESMKNELDMFDESMQFEMNELACEIRKQELEEQGLVTEAAAIQVVTESIADVWGKLKSMVMKGWQRIKSLYEAVKVKVMSFLTRDYNKFYKKHENTFNNYAKNTKGKYTFRNPKKNIESDLPFKTSKALKIVSDTMGETKDELDKDKEKIDNGDLYEELITEVIPGTSRSSFSKDFVEHYLDDKDSHEVLSAEIISEINKVLGTKNMISALDKAQKINNDFFKKLISDIDNCKNITSKYKKEDDMKDLKMGEKTYSTYEGNNAVNMERVNVLGRKITVAQSVNNVVNGAYISLVKKHISQCKSVFTKVVSRSKFTEETLLDAIADITLNESLEYLND